jgi:hypothetical protein
MPARRQSAGQPLHPPASLAQGERREDPAHPRKIAHTPTSVTSVSSDRCQQHHAPSDRHEPGGFLRRRLLARIVLVLVLVLVLVVLALQAAADAAEQ